MENEKTENLRANKIKANQINIALGLYMLMFSLIIFVAIFFTEQTMGKWTNFGAGLILFFIGGGMFLKGKISNKSL